MRVFCGFVLLLILIAISINGYNRKKDFLCPEIFYSFFIAIRYLPGIIYIQEWGFIEIDQNSVMLTTLIQSLATILVAFGIHVGSQYTLGAPEKYITYKERIDKRQRGIILYIVGMASNLLAIISTGGIIAVIENVQTAQVGNGNSYLMSFAFFAVIGLCIIMKCNKDKGKRPLNPFVVIMFLVYAALYIIQTRRSPVLEAVMILIFFYHYSIKPIPIQKLFKPRNIILIIFALVFIIIMPTFRTTEGFSNFSLGESIEKGFSSISHVLEEFCYTARDGFIYKNYNWNNFWYGRSLINLVCAPIPSKLLGAKPVVDDGMYLANAVVGTMVTPPANDFTWENSYPISATGTMYINFGIIGVIFGSLLLGLLYGSVYRIMKKNHGDFLFPIIYQLIIYQYEVSVLSTVQTLMPLLIVWITNHFVFRIKKSTIPDINYLFGSLNDQQIQLNK